MTELTDHSIDWSRPQDGFTLLELAVVVVLFASLFAGVWQLVGLCTTSLHSSQVAAELDTTVQTIYNRVSADLRESGTDDGGGEHFTSHPLIATTVSSTLTFQKRIDLTGNPMVDWGTPITYALTAEPGEIPANAVDDDGDGVVDEQRLTRTQDGVTVVIAERITRFLFSRQAGEFKVDFQVTVRRAFGPDKTPVTRVLTATVALANKGTP